MQSKEIKIFTSFGGFPPARLISVFQVDIDLPLHNYCQISLILSEPRGALCFLGILVLGFFRFGSKYTFFFLFWVKNRRNGCGIVGDWS